MKAVVKIAERETTRNRHNAETESSDLNNGLSDKEGTIKGNETSRRKNKTERHYK